MGKKVSEIHQTFSFQQRPWWKESLDKTAEKRAARKNFLRKSFIILCAKASENVRKVVDLKFVEKIENRVKWRNKMKFIGTEFCKLENGKLPIVRSLSWRKVPFNKPFCWICFFRFSELENVCAIYFFLPLFVLAMVYNYAIHIPTLVWWVVNQLIKMRFLYFYRFNNAVDFISRKNFIISIPK